MREILEAAEVTVAISSVRLPRVSLEVCKYMEFTSLQLQKQNRMDISMSYAKYAIYNVLGSQLEVIFMAFTSRTVKMNQVEFYGTFNADEARKIEYASPTLAKKLINRGVR